MFKLESQGNGLFYTLFRGEESIFFQDDDALYFENQLEKMELLGWNEQRILAELWNYYS